MKKLCVYLFLSFVFTCLVFAHDDPTIILPDPDKILSITDMGQPNAPVHCFGKAESYVTPYKGDKTKISSWVEDDGLKVKNMSDKTIVRMKIESIQSNTKGQGGPAYRDLDFRLPKSRPPLKPGETYEWPYKIGAWQMVGVTTTMSPAEYQSTPIFPAVVKAHVMLVVFEDGTTYEEPKYDGDWPLEP